MSNGYLVAARADAAAAQDLARGFGLDVMTPGGGETATWASALAGAANVGLLLSQAAARDPAFVALLQRVIADLRSAQVIAVEPSARAAFAFVPAQWPAMSIDEARQRAMRRLAASQPEPPPMPEPESQGPEPQGPEPQGPEPPPEPAPDHELQADTPLEPEPEPEPSEPEQTPVETGAVLEAEDRTRFAAAPRADPPASDPPDAADEEVADAGDALVPRAALPEPEGAEAKAWPPLAQRKSSAPQRITPFAAPADATAFAPKKLRRGTPELVRVVIHQPTQLREVIKAARKLDPNAQPAPQGMSIGDIAFGANVGIALEVRGASCEGALQRRSWAGEPLDFAFIVEAEAEAKQAVFLARVFVDDAQIGVLAFTRAISGAAKKPAEARDVRLKRHKRVFLSYSSQDREIVSAIASAYQMAGVAHFWDRASLKSGEEWSPRLRKEIERADLFHLCWSKAAAQSEWVAKEAEHALQRRRSAKRPEITVQMLDGPPWAPHPPALDAINFDDFVRAAVVGYARGDGAEA